MQTEPIRIVTAVIENEQGEVLLVRKKGSAVFIQPGGKREPGETAADALARELEEELGVLTSGQQADSIGAFESDAVNEPGRRVRAEAFRVRIEGSPSPRAEIEELIWLPPTPPYPVPVAPLSTDHILPAFRAGRRARAG